MKRYVMIFMIILILSIIAMLIDSCVGFDGNLSVVVAIAITGTFICHAINE